MWFMIHIFYGLFKLNSINIPHTIKNELFLVFCRNSSVSDDSPNIPFVSFITKMFIDCQFTKMMQKRFLRVLITFVSQ